MTHDELIAAIEKTITSRDGEITQKALAREIGIAEHTMGRIMTGKMTLISWRLKMKIMQWINRENKKKNTPEN